MKRALFLLVLLPGVAAAQGTGGLTVDAVVDGYYAYDFTRPPNRIRPFATQVSRHNEFNLNLALVRAQLAEERLRASFGLATGTYVEANYAAEPDLLKNIFEAYAGVNLGGDNWLDVGVFPSHIGFEYAISTLNPTYTRSLMAEYSPYYETGARLTLQPNDRFTVAVVVVNGWQIIRETNDAKSAGVQLVYKPSERLVLNYSNYVGDEAPDFDEDDPDSRIRFFNDFYAQLTLSDEATVTAAFDIGTQDRAGDEDATWYTGALVGSVALAPRWAVGGRLEFFHDPDQAVVSTGVDEGFEVIGGSLNLDYKPIERAWVRLEGRLLSAEDEIFPSNDGLDKTNALIVSSIAITF
jgi:hypothetical protein